MESIITQLTQQKAWEDFLKYRLLKCRFNWNEFDAADSYVEQEKYLHLAQKIVRGEDLGIPRKMMVNKMGARKKRVVYSFTPDEMTILKFIAYRLYHYDEYFAPNCYAFRRGVKAHDAIRRINSAISGRAMWAYKLDIHDYFNSISIDLLLPVLEEMLADDQPLFHFFERMLTNSRVEYNGEVILENHGVMAGVPTSPFLANVYLKEVDKHFHESGAIYARYSDDIIIFAPDPDTLEDYRGQMEEFLRLYRLEINPEKVNVYSPDVAYEFLGFKCHDNDIDISESTKKKMKGKIRRAANSLLRWSRKQHIPPEKAMKGLVNRFNRKFFEGDDAENLSWSRWFFPVINQSEGLREIDHYLQQYIRYLGTGRHCKTNYKTDYAQLKQMGYRSLVNEFYKFKGSRFSAFGL